MKLSAIVAGNGPSPAKIDYSRMPRGCAIFRANQFYLEDSYYLGDLDNHLERIKVCRLGDEEGDRFWGYKAPLKNNVFYKVCRDLASYIKGRFLLSKWEKEIERSRQCTGGGGGAAAAPSALQAPQNMRDQTEIPNPSSSIDATPPIPQKNQILNALIESKNRPVTLAAINGASLRGRYA